MMKRKELFKKIEERFSPFIKQGIAKISDNISYTSSNFFVFYPEGEKAGDGYFNLGIDCTLKNADLEKADNIALSVSVTDENGSRINMDICWGQPSGKIEAELYPQFVVITEEVLTSVEKEIPNFIDDLILTLKKYPNGL